MWAEWNVRDHLNTPTVPTHKKKKKKNLKVPLAKSFKFILLSIA